MNFQLELNNEKLESLNKSLEYCNKALCSDLELWEKKEYILVKNEYKQEIIETKELIDRIKSL
jgi:hypothetical protein